MTGDLAQRGRTEWLEGSVIFGNTAPATLTAMTPATDERLPRRRFPGAPTILIRATVSGSKLTIPIPQLVLGRSKG